MDLYAEQMPELVGLSGAPFNLIQFLNLIGADLIITGLRNIVGTDEGLVDGSFVGCDGFVLGVTEGFEVGFTVGFEVGFTVGFKVGFTVGFEVGFR